MSLASGKRRQEDQDNFGYTREFETSLGKVRQTNKQKTKQATTTNRGVCEEFSVVKITPCSSREAL